jgi:hypothetical protein
VLLEKVFVVRNDLRSEIWHRADAMYHHNYYCLPMHE